ncbi:MAG: Fe-S cluster assembly protein HesB [Acidimicrobiales bacterium]
MIRTLLEGDELPDGGGLRIASTNNGTQSLTVMPAQEPETGDQVVEDAGARVFVEDSAASLLGESVLDAQVDDDGNVQFLLTANSG